jgi:hypothetical protein
MFKMTARFDLVRTGLLTIALHVGVSVAAEGQSMEPGRSPTPAPMDRNKEIALALSACPEAVSAKAAVYVLDKSGYVKVRNSENGFTALVQHSMITSQEPQCMDSEGTRTFLPRMLKVAELRVQGKSPEEIKAIIADAVARGVLQPPTRPGVDYMLSTENRVPDDQGRVAPFPPHVMFYAPYLTNADLGSGGQAAGGPAFVAGEGSPYALVIVPIGSHGGSAHTATGAP